MKPTFAVPLEGGWLAYPTGYDTTYGSADAVAYFGDDELAAYRHANRHDMKVVYILPGETIAEAADQHASGQRG